MRRSRNCEGSTAQLRRGLAGRHSCRRFQRPGRVPTSDLGGGTQAFDQYDGFKSVAGVISLRVEVGDGSMREFKSVTSRRRLAFLEEQ